MPLQKSLTGDMRQMLMVSFAIVGLVLLVVCANVANLMLLRVTGRSRELAIRLALGAKPINLVRQLVMEGICLGAARGAGRTCRRRRRQKAAAVATGMAISGFDGRQSELGRVAVHLWGFGDRGNRFCAAAGPCGRPGGAA